MTEREQRRLAREAHRLRSCVGKIKMAAWKAQLEAARLGDGNEGYPCRYCRYWHVGHPPRWILEGKRHPPLQRKRTRNGK